MKRFLESDMSAKDWLKKFNTMPLNEMSALTGFDMFINRTVSIFKSDKNSPYYETEGWEHSKNSILKDMKLGNYSLTFEEYLNNEIMYTRKIYWSNLSTKEQQSIMKLAKDLDISVKNGKLKI